MIRRCISPLLLAAALTLVAARATPTAARIHADAWSVDGDGDSGVARGQNSQGPALCDSTGTPSPSGGVPSSKAPSRARDDTETDTNLHKQEGKTPSFKTTPPSRDDEDDDENSASLKAAPGSRDDEDEDRDLDESDDAADADDVDGD